MSPDQILVVTLGTGLMAVQPHADRTCTVGLAIESEWDGKDTDAIFEALSGSDLACKACDAFRLAPPLAAPDTPDLVMTLLAGSGGAFAPAGPGTGALSGVVVALSPGHGVYWNEDREVWTTQRGEHNGIIEDHWTARFATLWVTPMLEATGATVVDARAHVASRPETLVRAHDARFVPVLGGWAASAGPPDGALQCDPTLFDCEAFFELQVEASGVVPVLVSQSCASVPAPVATWTVMQAGITQRVATSPGPGTGTWTMLGRFMLEAGEPVFIGVRVPAGSPGPFLVEGARAGGGTGDTVRGGITSGAGRWQEGALYWLEAVGAPAWVTEASDTDLYDDRRSRGRMAAWVGADVFVALHTNGGGGTGTVTFVHESSPPAGSEELALLVQQSVVEAVRAGWDPAWVDRGVKAADMDELADGRPMPAALVELGFHDSEHDAALLRQPAFRRTLSAAVVRALVEHASPGAPAVPPAPEILSARNLGEGRLLVEWRPGTDPLVPADPTWTYELLVGTGTRILGARQDLGTGSSAVIAGFAPGSVVVARLVARSAAGSSLPSAGASVVVGDAPAGVLFVDGFDRQDEVVDETVNTRDTSLEHALALRDATQGRLAVDFATSSKAPSLVRESGYALVYLSCGLGGTRGCPDAPLALALADRIEAGGSVILAGADLAAAMLASGGAAADVLLSGAGALPAAAGSCEGPPVVFGTGVELVTGEDAEGTYACATGTGLAPLAGTHAVAGCVGHGVAVTLRPFAGGGGCALLDVPLEACEDAAGRAALVSLLLDAMGIRAPAPGPGTGPGIQDGLAPIAPSPAAQATGCSIGLAR